MKITAQLLDDALTGIKSTGTTYRDRKTALEETIEFREAAIQSKLFKQFLAETVEAGKEHGVPSAVMLGIMAGIRIARHALLTTPKEDQC